MAFSTDNIGKNCYINISEDENVEDSLYGTIIGYYKDTDKNEEYYFVSINGNVKRIYDDSLVNIVDDGGGGGSVTPQGIVDATSQMTTQQAADTVVNIGAEPEKFVVTVTESSGTYSADKTFAEIVAAYNTGKTIIVYLDYIVASLAYYSDADEEMYFSSLFEGYDNSYVFVNLFYVSSNDDWTYTQITLNKRPNLVTIIGSTPTITPAENTIYNCSTLTSLTISNPPATGSYSIVFTSGSTATTTTIPATILGLESFAPEANTLYEINVLDNRAVVGSWAVTP